MRETHDGVWKGSPAYIVCGDRVLIEMARNCPRNAREFLELGGVGTMKLELYGEVLLEELRLWRKEQKQA